ncbi:hypothetical protein GQ42DRAFT_169895 [Ramicandelaber brevisporus]|nr:hypothetical protein GQ42DRAFT_169895 [Ramicandelaber brevisporus]
MATSPIKYQSKLAGEPSNFGKLQSVLEHLQSCAYAADSASSVSKDTVLSDALNKLTSPADIDGFPLPALYNTYGYLSTLASVYHSNPQKYSAVFETLFRVLAPSLNIPELDLLSYLDIAAASIERINLIILSVATVLDSRPAAHAILIEKIAAAASGFAEKHKDVDGRPSDTFAQIPPDAVKQELDENDAAVDLYRIYFNQVKDVFAGKLTDDRDITIHIDEYTSMLELDARKSASLRECARIVNICLEHPSGMEIESFPYKVDFSACNQQDAQQLSQQSPHQPAGPSHQTAQSPDQSPVQSPRQPAGQSQQTAQSLQSSQPAQSPQLAHSPQPAQPAHSPHKCITTNHRLGVLICLGADEYSTADEDAAVDATEILACLLVYNHFSLENQGRHRALYGVYQLPHRIPALFVKRSNGQLCCIDSDGRSVKRWQVEASDDGNASDLAAAIDFACSQARAALSAKQKEAATTAMEMAATVAATAVADGQQPLAAAEHSQECIVRFGVLVESLSTATFFSVMALPLACLGEMVVFFDQHCGRVSRSEIAAARSKIVPSASPLSATSGTGSHLDIAVSEQTVLSKVSCNLFLLSLTAKSCVLAKQMEELHDALSRHKSTWSELEQCVEAENAAVAANQPVQRAAEQQPVDDHAISAGHEQSSQEITVSHSRKRTRQAILEGDSDEE